MHTCTESADIKLNGVHFGAHDEQLWQICEQMTDAVNRGEAAAHAGYNTHSTLTIKKKWMM